MYLQRNCITFSLKSDILCAELVVVYCHFVEQYNRLAPPHPTKAGSSLGPEEGKSITQSAQAWDVTGLRFTLENCQSAI